MDIEEFKQDYNSNLLSIAKLSEKYNMCPSSINKLIKELGIYRDKKAVKSLSNKIAKGKFFENLKKTISKDMLEKYYIEENHGYYETQKHFNISDWTFNHLLNEYGLKKDRKITAKQSVKTREEKAGGKDKYFEKQQLKNVETKIKKYGSMENYKQYISNKCIESYAKIPDEVKRENAKRTLSHGGGWNKDTIKKTLQEKYGVDNAYKLADSYQTNSKVNQAFADKLTAHNINYLREQNYGNMRYDFQVDKTLIEINPWPFHNTTFCPIADALLRSKYYHRNKSKVAEENNFRCIHIFDWDDEDKIINLLVNKTAIYARKCRIKTVSQQEAKSFINKYHLQGYARDSIRVGLYSDDELVAIMTFGKPRYNKNYEYELIRFCSSQKVIGGADKLFSYFKNTYLPSSIISYCDNSKFTGQTYLKLGFELKSSGQPSKHWFNIKTGEHITDNLLRKQGFDRLLGKEYGCYGKGTSNETLMREHSFVEIWDCGQSTYIWKNSDN